MMATASRFAFLAIATIATFAPGELAADFLADREALNADLGSAAVNESFEKYNIAPRDPDLLGTSSLDANTITNGKGPGLVVPGVVFRARPDAASGLQWNPTGYEGLVTRTISGGGNLLTIDFTAPTTAFGVGVQTYRGQSMLIRATIYASDDTTVLATRDIPTAVPTQTFLGYTDATNGIGKVELLSTTKPFTPVIDDLAFGAVPGPRIVSFVISTGMPRVRFSSVAGRNYRVERKDELSAVDWAPVAGAENVSGTGDFIEVDDSEFDAGCDAKRFYRVVMLSGS